MTPDEYIAVIERDGRALADAAEAAGMDAVVAACPGWTVTSLVAHVGEVHDFWRRIAHEQLDDPAKMQREVPELEGDALLAWYRAGVDQLVSVLAASDPSTPVWSWATQKDVAFIQRRMAQETIVHRWDAEAAAGRAYAIAPELAVDGVEEFLEFFAAFARKGAEPLGGTVHLHATDADGEWFIEPAGDALSVRREHAKGDVAVRASASDLLLQLWRRPAAGDVQVFGDGEVLASFLARTDLE